MKRTLALKREALTELAHDELGSVVGGTTPITRTCTPIVSYAECLIIQTVLADCF